MLTIAGGHKWSCKTKWFYTNSKNKASYVYEELKYDSDPDADSDNGLFDINTVRYISMACNVAYLTVYRQCIPQCFIELLDSKVWWYIHSLQTYLTFLCYKDVLWITLHCGTLIRIYVFEAVHGFVKIYTPFKTAWNVHLGLEASIKLSINRCHGSHQVIRADPAKDIMNSMHIRK